MLHCGNSCTTGNFLFLSFPLLALLKETGIFILSPCTFWNLSHNQFIEIKTDNVDVTVKLTFLSFQELASMLGKASFFYSTFSCLCCRATEAEMQPAQLSNFLMQLSCITALMPPTSGHSPNQFLWVPSDIYGFLWGRGVWWWVLEEWQGRVRNTSQSKILDVIFLYRSAFTCILLLYLVRERQCASEAMECENWQETEGHVRKKWR